MANKSKRSRSHRKARTDRPPKPQKDFPLSPHASGHWCKRIKGKLYYFGRWGRRVDGKLVRIEGDGWQAALERYKFEKDDLYSGRKPRGLQGNGEALIVKDLCNRFLTAKKLQLEAGEITARTFAEYKNTTDRLFATFGKNRRVDNLASDDFEHLRAGLAKTNGPVRLGNEIQRVKTVFKYGYEAGLIDKPVRFGPHFKKPAKHVLRKHRAERGGRTLEAADVRRMIEQAPTQLKAMILLGVNCGFGNNDCGLLPLSAVDLEGGWIGYPRPKTGIERRCPMWPETVEALRTAIAERRTPNDETGLVFVTTHGEPWAKDGTDNPITKETRKLLDTLKLHRPGLGFYSLRHTFRTVADATRDFPAVRLVMGHADASIDDVYRERIDDARLIAVAEHVRAWLFPPADEPQQKPKKRAPRKAKPKPAKPTAKDRKARLTSAIDERPALRIVG